jgi:hypothetical protein
MAGLLKERQNKNDWKAYLKKNEKVLMGINASFSLYEVSQKLSDEDYLKKIKDDWFTGAVTVGTLVSSSISVMQAVYNLFTAADKELFEMYNGYAEAYSNFLADRKYGTLSDDVFNQNLQEVKSTSTTSSHLIYIENWRSAGVIDRLSTIKMSGLFYDLYDSQNDFINDNLVHLEMANNISWENIAKAGLGKLGLNSSPDQFTHWRNNLTISLISQLTPINNVFNWYLYP